MISAWPFVKTSVEMDFACENFILKLLTLKKVFISEMHGITAATIGVNAKKDTITWIAQIANPGVIIVLMIWTVLLQTSVYAKILNLKT